MRAGLTIWNRILWYTEMKNAHKQVKNTWSEKEDMSVIISYVTRPLKQEQRSEIIRCFTELSRHRISCFSFRRLWDCCSIFKIRRTHCIEICFWLNIPTITSCLVITNYGQNRITFANDFYHVKCVSYLSKPVTHVSDDLPVVTTETH